MKPKHSKSPEAWKTYLLQIWGILFLEAGASRNDRDQFVAVGMGYRDGRLLEYRFCGKLGFGGKVWINNGPVPYVTCYPEDGTPYRQSVIKTTNAWMEKFAALEEVR